MAKEYIEREAVLKGLSKQTSDLGLFGAGVTLGKDFAAEVVRNAPAADVVEVFPELRETVTLLHKEYEKAEQSPFVHDPLAYALYHTWRAVDGRCKNGR